MRCIMLEFDDNKDESLDNKSLCSVVKEYHPSEEDMNNYCMSEKFTVCPRYTENKQLQ